MKASMLRRQSKISTFGNKVYIGSEAYPYSDNQLLIVTNQTEKTEVVEKPILIPDSCTVELFCQQLSEVAFKTQPEEVFFDYVKENFSDLSLQPQERNEGCVKGVNYYACRFTAIFCAYFIKYDDQFSPERLFKQIESVENSAQKSIIVSDYAKNLSKRVQEKCLLIKENFKINGESIFSDEQNLLSQVCIIIANEKNEASDLVYLNYGNSRGFIWNKEGLMQIAKDSDFIADEFELSGAYLNDVIHPFTAICASSGCLNCPVFASPLDFEYLFLETIKKNIDLEKTVRGLEEIFLTIANHYLSNSMALLCHGFSDYAQLKDLADLRRDYIEKNILSVLPGIFEKDYILEAENAENRLIRALSSCTDLLMNSKIRALVVDEMLKNKYQPLIFDAERYIKANDASGHDYYLRYGEEISETVKRFYRLKKEDIINQKKNASIELISLIKANWQTGVNFSSLDIIEEPYFKGEEFHYDDSEKEKMIKVYLLIKNRQNMDFNGENFIYRDAVLQVPENKRRQFSYCLDKIFGEKHRLAFLEYLQVTVNSYIKDYYLKECSFMAKEIYAEYGEDIIDFCDLKTINEFNALKKAKENHKMRLKIYAEYEKNYKKLFELLN
ncbi:MAG: hypothetical protein IJA15_01880 [Clostridia bacterium]|nr:hypothetical protein [Clostridia bacterium]